MRGEDFADDEFAETAARIRKLADQANVQTALNSDAAVVAARMQLQADATRVSNDVAVLQADVAQLQKDLHG